MRKDQGFTIIELMVVISVLGMLTLMLMPNVSNIRTKSREMALKTNMYKLQTLLESYYYDYGSYIDGDSVPAASLFETFCGEGYISNIPKNPFTGQPFSAQDTVGIIRYSKDGTSYSMKSYKTDGSPVLHEVTGS